MECAISDFMIVAVNANDDFIGIAMTDGSSKEGEISIVNISISVDFDGSGAPIHDRVTHIGDGIPTVPHFGDFGGPSMPISMVDYAGRWT